jgi:hypothetical protein
LTIGIDRSRQAQFAGRRPERSGRPTGPAAGLRAALDQRATSDADRIIADRLSKLVEEHRNKPAD